MSDLLGVVSSAKIAVGGETYSVDTGVFHDDNVANSLRVVATVGSASFYRPERIEEEIVVSDYGG